MTSMQPSGIQRLWCSCEPLAHMCVGLSTYLVYVSVQGNGRAVLHEGTPDVDVEVERVVHEVQPVLRLFPNDMVAGPVEILHEKSERRRSTC